MNYTAGGNIDYTTGSRCGVENCKARKYYIEEGYTYCKNGHQQDIVSDSPKIPNVGSSVTAATRRGHKPSRPKMISRVKDA